MRKCGRYLAGELSMLIDQPFDEIRVYAGFAERTGVHFDRSAVRRSGACCRSVTELVRKARAAGDGDFYMPLSVWPANMERVPIQKPWVVIR
jgi:hypothetical protein